MGKQILFNEAQRKQMERKEKFRKGFKEGVSKFGSGVWNTVKKKAQESKKKYDKDRDIYRKAYEKERVKHIRKKARSDARDRFRWYN